MVCLTMWLRATRTVLTTSPPLRKLLAIRLRQVFLEEGCYHQPSATSA